MKRSVSKQASLRVLILPLKSASTCIPYRKDKLFRNMGVEVVYLPRTPEIHTTQVKENAPWTIMR